MYYKICKNHQMLLSQSIDKASDKKLLQIICINNNYIIVN